jgi:hypothetical protein
MAEDPTLRTIHGAILSFDETHNGRFVLNVLGGKNERHIELTSGNMEELMDLIGKVYYGAVEESSEDFMVRLMKRAIREDRQEEFEHQARLNYENLKRMGMI